MTATWALWNKSKTWRLRPSEIVGEGWIDPYTAYCLDEAVYTWGRFVEGELDKASADNNKKKKRSKKDDGAVRQAKLNELLGMPMEVRYRSFRAAAGKAPVAKED